MGNDKIKELVTTAIFAAITFLGIQAFRIPMPAAVGTPFVHFGHIFVVMGVLLQGGRRGAVSGTLGLIVFDLVNGYIQAMPQVFVETIIKCLIIGAVFHAFKEKGSKTREYTGAIVCAIIYACMNIVIEFAMGIVNLMILGSSVKAAAAGSAVSIPATVINAVFMVIAVAVIYKPIVRLYIRAAGQAA